MLSLSKHEKSFFSNLSECEFQEEAEIRLQANTGQARTHLPMPRIVDLTPVTIRL